MSRRSARLILDRVDLQPHRTRYGPTTRLDGRFKARAEKVVWCYGNAERLAWRGSAELLIHVFGDCYPKRTSWHNREEFIQHVENSWPEYNESYAHPFEGTWTNQGMRRWFVRHGG